MTDMARLIARCKHGVYMDANRHRDYHDTVAVALSTIEAGECPPDIADDVRAGILSSGVLVELRFYPDTSVGSYHVVHFDADAAVREALEIIDDLTAEVDP